MRKLRQLVRYGIWCMAAVVFMELAAGGSGLMAGSSALAHVSPAGLATPSQTVPAGEGDGGELSLSVSDYRLSRSDKPKERVDSLKKGGTARLTVTVTGNSSLKDIKKGDLVVSRRRDGYQTDGQPSVKVVSDRGEPLEFQVTFPKITYTGGDTAFHFQVRKKGSSSGTILAVKLDETEQASAGSSRKGRSRGGTGGQPAVKIERTGTGTPLEPGKTQSYTLKMTNTSRDTDMEDLTVVFNPAPPLYLSQDTNSHIVGRLRAGQSAEVKVTLKAGQDLAGVPQALDVEFRYTYDADGQQTSGTVSQKVMIPTSETSLPGQPFVRVSHTREAEAVRPGEEFHTVVRLENTGAGPVSNLILTVDPSEQIALMDPVDTYFVGRLEPGKTAEVPVRLKASQDLAAAPSQLVGVGLKFDYDSGKGTVSGTQTGRIVIPAAGGKGVSASLTPNLIIRSYSYGGSAQAGQVFDLSMEIVNTSKNIPVENILMSLNTGEGLSINESSNTIYIPSLAPGAAEKRTVRMQALFQSKLQSPKVEISFKYEYMDHRERKQNTTAETIAIPVYQPDRLEVRPPSFPDGVREQEESPLSIFYNNKGRGQLFNMEAKLEGDIKALEKEVSVGNLEPGKTGTIDFIVIPEKAGPFRGQVRITYEDEAMNQKEIMVPVEFQAEEAPPPVQELSPLPEESRRGKGLPLLLAAGCLTAGCGGMALAVCRRRAGNRKGDREGAFSREMTDGWEPWEEREEERDEP